MTQLRLLGLSGSLRRASNCTAVLRGLQDALTTKARLDIFSLHGLPLYNEDEDGEHAPESVCALPHNNANRPEANSYRRAPHGNYGYAEPVGPLKMSVARLPHRSESSGIPGCGACN